MAIFSVEILDSDVDRVIESLCINYGRPENILDNNGNNIPNPETKSVFANRMVREFLADHVRRYEIDQIKKQIEQSIIPPTINNPYL